MGRTILWLLCLTLAVACAQAHSIAQSSHADSLRGMKGVGLTVWISREGPIDAQQRAALTKLLQENAEAKLMRAGIRLLKPGSEIENEPGSPRLYVSIVLDKSHGHLFRAISESSLFQKARLSRDPSLEYSVSTWETHSVGDYNLPDLSMIGRQVDIEIDQFIKAYLIANAPPK